MVAGRGGGASCKSQRQPMLAVLSTKGEYLAMSDAAHKEMWLKSVAKDVGVGEHPTTMFFENQEAAKLSESDCLHRHTKHISVCHHLIRDCIASMKLDIKYVPTGELLTDVFTKYLGRVKHAAAVKDLGLI